MQPNPRQQSRPTKSYEPKKRKTRAASVLPLMLLFVALLIVMWMIFPKEAGHQAGTTKYTGLVISEVMSSNSTAVPDENGNFPDWLEVYNGTGAALDMEGVFLTNRTDRICFPFPAITLAPEQRVIVFADNTYQLDPSKPFHGKFKLASVGSHLYLYSPDKLIINELAVPTMASDESYILSGYDAAGQPVYETTTYYSPGFENTQEGFSAYRTSNATEVGSLVINEVCPDPKVGIPDEEGEVVDWVELRNTTDRDINLTGYALSDKENKPLKWRFPDGAIIPANGYYLIYCSGKDRLQQNGIPHTNFSISAERETLVLSDAYGRQLDRIAIENVPVDQSIGRNETGAWSYFVLTTPGLPNTSAGQARADELIRAFNPTGVYISEIMASNDTILLGASGEACDFVELYNSSGNVIDLSNYGLSDNLGRPRRWQFPSGIVINPGEYKIVYLDSNTAISTYYEVHTNFSLSQAGGETINFCDPSGKVLDRIPLNKIPTDKSYGRTIGMNGFYYYDVPTPGAANGTGFYGYVNNPSFTLRGGEYKGTVEVSINVPDNMVVYYTDEKGDIPTESSKQYTPGEVLTYSRVTVLRARAFDPTGQLQPSDTITQTYLLNVYHAFPIVSVVADPNELWNPETGILTVGDNVDKSNGIPFKNTIYREIKEDDHNLGISTRPGYVEMYDKEGNQLFSQGMEFGLQGQFSLDFPQKSFKIKAKAKYGAKTFTASLFEDRPFTEYKGFVLRISGNDSAFTRINDGFQGRLVDQFNEITDKPSTLIHQAWKPVSVYLNGMYWGHYNLRERVDRFFVAQHEGLSLDEADSMDILEASGTVNFGSNKEYKAMIAKMKTLAPNKNPEDLQYIYDNIDVDNYIDYMAFEMFFGNSDPGNIRYYKLKTEGSKWKWILYDLDWAMFRSGFDSVTSYLKPKGAGDKYINNTILLKVIESDELRDKFLTRLGEIYQVFTTDFMMTTFNEMADIIRPEMEMHFARWAEENDKAINSDSPTSPTSALRYWNTRLDYTRNVIRKRPRYFYEMVQERLNISDADMLAYFGVKPELPEDAIVTPNKKWG